MQNIEEIYKQHSKTVYKYLFCLTGKEDTAEELTQETFAIAVKEIKNSKVNVKYLYGCVRLRNIYGIKR